MARDYYEVLGVERDANARTIKRAFLEKARELHPDVSDDPDAESKFKEVNEAYSVLSDPEKRSNYDRFGSADAPAGFDMSDIFGGGLDDIFSSFFGGNPSGAATQRPRTSGRDMGIRLTISLAEAASGCTKTVAYDRMAPCETCSGTGLAEDGKVETCSTCHGTGRVVTYQRTIIGSMQTQSTCPDCSGVGQSVRNPCPACHGDGRVRVHEKVSVEIPAGVTQGMRLTIPEKGEAGIRGDVSGSLYVEIAIEPSETFERDGDDLWCQHDVSAFDAMLGCTLTIDGILADERVKVEVPAGTQPGDRLVVSGAGMPRTSGGRGRMIVIANIVIPRDLSEDERAAIKRMSDARSATKDSEAGASDVASSESDETGTRPKKHSKRPHKRSRK